ncbi:MAG: NUDIX hydrolase [Chloroflexi bacterium]|nr:NUDIX hydrolase [Chloroflexota bacterium]
MNDQIITFDQGKARFNLRVVGVALDAARVLLHRGEEDDFWTLPGGRGEFLEPATDTLRREMREELGVAVQVGRLLWVVENFFDYDGKSYHELALYFLMSLPQRSRLRAVDEFEGSELLDGGATLKLLFKWFPLAGLEGIALYPTFLRQGLRSLPPTTEHVVHRDGELS